MSSCICETHQAMLNNFLKVGPEYKDLETKLNQTRQEHNFTVMSYRPVMLEIEQTINFAARKVSIEIWIEHQKNVDFFKSMTGCHDGVRVDYDEEYENREIYGDFIDEVTERIQTAYADKLALYDSHLIEIQSLDQGISDLSNQITKLTSINNLMYNLTKDPFTQQHYQCFIEIVQQHLRNDVTSVYHHIWKRMNDPVFLKYFIEHSGVQPTLDVLRPESGRRIRPNTDLNPCLTIILHQLQKNQITYDSVPAPDYQTNPNHQMSCIQYLLDNNCAWGINDDSCFGNYYEPLLPNGKIMGLYSGYIPAGWQLDDGVLVSC